MKRVNHGKAVAAKPARERRPRNSPERTREQLVQAALELFQQGGIAAVTTTNVTRAIGLTQSGFYQHFSNVDECMQEAAQKCGEQFRKYVLDHLQVAQSDSQDPFAAHVMHFTAVLQLCRDQRTLAELLIRYRYEDSPIGRTMKQLHYSMRADLLRNLNGIASSHYPHLENDPRLLMLVDCLLAMSFAACEMVLESRGDVEALASELAQYTYAMCGNLVGRS